MRQLALGLALIVVLVSCDKTFKPRPVPFDTDPSVLRGSWSGNIENFPDTGQTTLFEVLNSVATFCPQPDEQGQCSSYTFSASLQVGEQAVQTITGEGFAGSVIYTQTSPIPQASIQFDFSFNEETYKADFDYWGNGDFRGSIRLEDKFYNLTLTQPEPLQQISQ